MQTFLKKTPNETAKQFVHSSYLWEWGGPCALRRSKCTRLGVLGTVQMDNLLVPHWAIALATTSGSGRYFICFGFVTMLFGTMILEPGLSLASRGRAFFAASSFALPPCEVYH